MENLTTKCGSEDDRYRKHEGARWTSDGDRAKRPKRPVQWQHQEPESGRRQPGANPHAQEDLASQAVDTGRGK